MPDRITIPAGRSKVHALFDVPEQTPPRAALLLCHSWPGLGGSVKEPVLRAVSAAMLARGAMVLRIKFRRVARDAKVWQRLWPSAQADIRAGRRFLRERVREYADGDAIPLVGAGYSYGAFQLSAAAHRRDNFYAIALVGPPIRYARRRMHTRAGPPTLIVTGADDIYCPPAAAFSVQKRRPDSMTVHVLDGANHFLKGREAEVAELVSDFLMKEHPAREHRDDPTWSDAATPAAKRLSA